MVNEEDIRGLIVSIYRFQLAPKAKGLYLLPPITVTVGGKVYKSIEVSYDVHHAAMEVISPTTPTVFRLEALYDGPSPLHISERGFLIYRIYFNRSIDITKSELPFLNRKIFARSAALRLMKLKQEISSSQEIKQAIEATKEGSFTYGPAVIEGTIYTTNIHGEKEATGTVHAVAPPVTIVVVPFPVNKIPPSFNGAIGEFSIKASLSGSPEAYVGDEVGVAITISGEGNLDDVRLPNLQCEPGFSGLFSMGDLPPAGEVKGNTKLFTLMLRPRSTLIKAVPPIEFSYFNVKTKQYTRLKTSSLLLKVKALPETPDNKKTTTEVASGE